MIRSPIPLGRAFTFASSVISEAEHAGIGAEAITAVGSLRRFAPEVGKVALLGVVPVSHYKQTLKAFARLPRRNTRPSEMNRWTAARDWD